MQFSNEGHNKLAFYSALAARLQNGRARKTLVFANIIFGAVFGAVLAYVVWLFITPATAGPLYTVVLFAFAASAFLIERLLFLSIQSALPIEGQPFDERQQQLVTAAHLSARTIILLAMLGLIILGSILLFQGHFGMPLSTTAPLFIWVGVALLFIAYQAHYLVLAWQFPEEIQDESDEDHG